MKRVWKTKDGKRLLIKDMKTSHIKNCIYLLERNHLAMLDQIISFSSGFMGEMAMALAENTMLDVMENGFEDELDDYIESFKMELEKRGEKLTG